MRRFRQVYERHKGLPREGTLPGAQPEKKTLPPPVRATGSVFVAVWRALAVLGRVFVVVGRVVGYALLIVATFAVSVALGAGIAVAMEYLVGWPDTWWL